jgi:glutamate synthase domain-containing protein 2
MWVQDIIKRAENEKPPASGGRCNKMDKVSLEDLIFIPAQLAKRPYDYFRDKIDSSVVLGKTSKKPVTISMPIVAAGMSFGALSKEAKIAIAKGTAAVGTWTNTGEGGMLPEERKNAKILVAQYSTGRFGVDDAYLNSADIIEIKIGQGAKPGQGGLLPAYKVTDEIIKVRKLRGKMDVHSPPAHPDIKSLSDLKKKVSFLRKKTGGKPIIIKLGAGDIEKDVKLAVKANPDIIAIDGILGGTGAAPEIMLNDFGTPLIPAIVQARSVLRRMRAKQDLIVGGGLNRGADMAKALALGADAVFVGFPLMVAMGCRYCKQCYKGECPYGIATQDPVRRKKLSIPKSSKGVENYLRNCNEEIKMAAAATGNNDVKKLTTDDLRALTFNMSRISGIKLVGD